MSGDKKTLESVRESIDAIDQELRRLLNERAAWALKVAEIKQADPGEEPPVYYRPEREAQILARLKKENEGPLSDDDIARLFREIISCCRTLEQPLTISYLGPPGTYSEMAVIKQFG
ncbi:MAG: chorismate mutase, partial [Gammaproteobacteria bacterium]